jgi:hypothetical protein
VDCAGWPKRLWRPTEMSAYVGRTASRNAGVELYAEPWWPTLRIARLWIFSLTLACLRYQISYLRY